MGTNVTNDTLVWPSGSYSEATFKMTIKRQGSTITVTVIAPGLAITFMSLLYIFLPMGGGERVPYIATIILTEIMFLVMLTNFVPLSRDLPMLEALFFSLTILLCVMTIPIIILEWKVKKKQAQEAEEKEGKADMASSLDD